MISHGSICKVYTHFRMIMLVHFLDNPVQILILLAFTDISYMTKATWTVTMVISTSSTIQNKLIYLLAFTESIFKKNCLQLVKLTSLHYKLLSMVIIRKSTLVKSTSSVIQNDARAFLYMSKMSWYWMGKITKRRGFSFSSGSDSGSTEAWKFSMV